MGVSKMGELQVIEYQNQRVLTTAQLAESYGTDKKVISYNFNNNKKRYTEEKHFFALEGEDKRAFINRLEIHDSSKNAKTIYLWTEKGAWMHAKSLNTDQAWNAYEMLVDEYYKIKESIPQLSSLSPQLQLLIQMEMQMKQLEERAEQVEKKTEQIDEKMNVIAETFTQDRNDNWRRNIVTMLKRIAYEDGSYARVVRKSYERLESATGAQLDRRLNNLRQRMAYNGATKTEIKSQVLLVNFSARLRTIDMHRLMNRKYVNDTPSTSYFFVESFLDVHFKHYILLRNTS